MTNLVYSQNIRKTQNKNAIGNVFFLSIGKMLMVAFVLVCASPSFGQTTYNQSFDGSFPPSNWLDFAGTGSSVWIQGLNGSLINPTISSHSGAGVAMWNSYSIVAPNTANLVTPVIDQSARGANTPTFSLWWVRDNANYNTSTYTLEGITVYANTVPNLTGSPVTLGFIPRCGTCANATGAYLASGPVTQATTGWYQYVFNFPAAFNTGTNYIIIQAYAQDGDNCYMDDVSWVAYETPCVAPSNQPTGLNLTTISTTEIDGSFTAASGTDGYLVVRYPQGSSVTNPVNGTSYSLGGSLGLGKIVSTTSATTFNNTGLFPGTSYDYYVYSYNFNCTGGPIYNTSSPLSGNASTNSCTGLAGGTYSIGPSGGYYASLTAAIADITTNGLTGPVILEFQNSYVSSVETFPIVLGSNACITPTNNLTIRPDATNSTPLAITGNSATEILDFNGGKYIKIDGRPGGTGSSEMLQIINTNAAAVATVRFINEAQNDTITFCDIQGQSTTSTSNPVTSAVILFAGTNVTVANGGTGNDNNGITYSDIHATSGGTPAIGIGAGITQTAGLATDNDNNTIYSCNIYDFFSATLATDGIKLDIGNNAWTISKCNFYETVPRSGSNAAANWFRFIHLNPNTSAASFSYGSGHTVTLNQFGGTNSSGTGTMLLTSSGAATMIGMDISVGNGTGTIVNGNTFQNITFTSTSTALLTGGTTGAMAMISVNYGNVTSISSNTINNMTLAPGSGGTFMGIRIGGGLGTITTNVINNNTISNISISPTTATNAGNFIGIDMNGGTTVEQITNNSIFNITNGSTATTLASGQIIGIGTYVGQSSNTLYPTISGNIIHDFTTYSLNASTIYSAGVIGILIYYYSTPVYTAVISGNQIYKFTNATTTSTVSFAPSMWGIAYYGYSGTPPLPIVPVQITGNLIHTFDMPSWNSTNATTTGIPVFGGIYSYYGFTTIANNMVRMGINASGTAITKPIQFIGISKAQSFYNNIWHNSVYIGGTGVYNTSALAYSAAFQRTVTSSTLADDVRDNIFVNVRSNLNPFSTSNTAKHYAVWLNNTGYLTLNYNDYQYSNGTSNYLATVNNGSDIIAYSSNWAAGDANSRALDPKFVSPTAGTPDLHIQTGVATPIESAGINIASITTDYDGQARAAYTPVDIGADAGTFTVLPACATPTAQPTALTFGTITNSSISGSFTAASPAPDAYLVVIYAHNASPTGPSNGTTYYPGAILGSGVVVSVSSSTSFTAAPLSSGTQYDFYVYSYNQNCSGGPLYFGTSPLSGNATTTGGCGSGLNGTYSVGPTGTYASLTAALAALTSNGLAGPVLLELQASYVSTVETFPLTISNFGCLSATNTLTIRPAAGANGLVIASNTTTGAGTFDFNAGATAAIGAQFVTIDGRPGGTGGFTSGINLVIKNGTTTASASSPAIRFINDARYNTIAYCDLQANNNTAATTSGTANGGVVNFGTANTVNLNGNDYNTVSNCDIHSIPGATIGLVAGVASAGSTTTVYAFNDNNTITNCNIYDVFSATVASAAIYIGNGTTTGGNSAWTISNNKIYQTATRTYTSALVHRGIWVTPMTTTLGNSSGFIISGNTIGFGAANGTGTYTMTGSVAYTFYGMDISVGYGIPTSVQGNTISGINMTTASSLTPTFLGINLNQGNINVGTASGNIIGASTGTGAISVTSSVASSVSYGIRIIGGTSSVYNISNNTIGAITVSGSTTSINASLVGIASTGGSSTVVTVNNNLIGSTSTANSLNLATAYNSTGTQQLLGISVTSGPLAVTVSNNTIANLNNSGIGTLGSLLSVAGINITVGIATVTGNTVKNLTSGSTGVGVGAASSIVGIVESSTSVATYQSSLVSGNTVFGLSNTSGSTTVANQITGIFWQGAAGPLYGMISKNKVYNMGMTGADTLSTLTGIDCGSAGWGSFVNNVVRMGYDASGNPITTSMIIRGIQKGATTANVWFNSVYVGGSGVGTSITRNSYAFGITTINTADDVRNNIFDNVRQNASTGGIHAAIGIANQTTAFTLNFNDYYYAGSNGSIFAYNIGTAASISTYTINWLAGDAASKSALDPQFINPTGTTPDLHISTSVATPVEATGQAISSITDDFDGNNRSTLTPTDMGAYAGNYIQYAFACSGTPTGGTTVSTTNYACSAVNFTLSLTGNTTGGIGTGITFQWQSSPNGTSWTPISGATAATYAVSQTVQTYYQCVITCTNSSSSATSTSLLILMSCDNVQGGTTVSTRNPACSGTPFTLSLSGNTNCSGTTYLWGYSYDNINWVNISGATGATYTVSQTVPTYWWCTVTCNGNSTFSSSLYIPMDSYINCYCTPTITSFLVGMGISSFSTTGGTTNITNNGTATGIAYTDYTNLSVSQIQGSSYNFSVSGPGTYAQGYAIWIDWNHDGAFTGAGEAVWNSVSTSTGTFTGTITIPATALTGNTTMRVRSNYSALPTDPCASQTYGEAEDYRLIVNAAPPTITNISPTSGCSNATLVITGNFFTGATAVTVGGTAVSSFVVNSSTQITAIVGAGSTGVVTVTGPNGTGSGSQTFTYNGAGPTITCPASSPTANAPSNQCNAVVNYTVTPSFGTLSFVATGATTLSGSGSGDGSTFNVGTTNVTVSATSGACVTQCSFSVIVNDVTPPTISGCPSSVSVAANTAGCTGATVTFSTPTAADNCNVNTTGTATFNYTGSIVTWTVPTGVTSATITAKGASGGFYTGGTPGKGASMTGTFSVTAGQVLSILVGQSPGLWTTSSFSAGGGGTFVALGSSYTTASPLIVAGGGGGAYANYTGTDAPVTTSGTGSYGGTNGNGGGAALCGGGGGGFYTSGASDSYSIPGAAGFRQGGAGAIYSGYQTGGFGGGATASYPGSCYLYSGSGGGYSGGGGVATGCCFYSGSAGGSYNGGTSQNNIAGNNSGNGVVTINYGATYPYVTQTAGLASGSVFPIGVTTNTFTAIDAAGLTSTCSFNVTVTAPTAAVTNSTGATRCGPGTVTLNATATSGDSLHWYANATGGSILAYGPSISPNVTATTTFYVDAFTSPSLCESSPRVAVVATVTPPPALTVTANQSICLANSSVNNIATLTVTSNVSDYDNYTWSPITNLYTDAAATVAYTGSPSTATVYFKSSTAGTYTITCNATNSTSGCANVTTTIITVVANPTFTSVTASSGHVCPGSSVTLSASSATGISYNWQPINLNGASVTDNPSANTTYTVTTANSTGCTAASTVTVLVGGTPVAASMSGNICISGSATLTASGSGTVAPYSYLWSTGATTSTMTDSPGSTSYYTVNVTDACGSQITVNDTIYVNNPTVVNTTGATRCGTGSLSLQATASSGSTLNWYPNSTGGSSIGTGSPFNTPVINTTTTYYVSASAGAAPVHVGPQSPNPAAVEGIGQLYYGDEFSTTGPVTISTMKVYPYNPVNGTACTFTVNVFPCTIVGNAVTINPVAVTTSTVSATAYTQSPLTAQVVTVNLNIPSAGTYFICPTFGTGTTGMFFENTAACSCTYPYTGGGVSILGASYSSTSATMQTSGLYYYFYDWVVGGACESGRTAVTATVTTPPSVTATAAQSTVCSGSSTTLSATSSNDPNYTYVWTPGNLTGSAVSVSTTTATTYTVTATDNTNGTNAGCATTATTTVTVNPLPPIVVSPVNSTVCSGSSINLTAGSPTCGGVTTYNFAQSSSTWTPITGGTVVASGTTWDDGTFTGEQIGFSFQFGCTNYTTFALDINGDIRFGTNTGTYYCPTNLAAGGNATGVWGYMGDLHGDGNSASEVRFQTIGTSPNRKLVVQWLHCMHYAGNTSDDWNFQIVLNETTNAVQVIWGPNTDITTMVANTCADVNGEGFATGLMGTSSTDANLRVVTNGTNTFATSTNATTVTTTNLCEMSSTNVPATGLTWTWTQPLGGTNFAWAPSSSLSSSSGSVVAATPPSTTTYTVTTTDNNGCTNSATATVSVNLPPVVATSNIVNVSCNGGSDGSITATITGGSGGPFTYHWSDGTVSTSSFTFNTLAGISAGTYSVTVTAANGCPAALNNIVVTQPNPIVPNSVINNVSCNGGANGSILISPTGGTPGYTYFWSNGGTTSSISNLNANLYVVTVTDSHGCTATGSTTLTQPTILSSTATATANASCNGGSNGTASVSASGGTPPYNGTGTRTGLTAGTYNFIVTDSHGCTATASAIVITQPSAITASSSVVSNVSCPGGSNGSASVTASGGTAPYSGTGTFTGLTAGSYTYIVTDNNGCTGSSTVVITQPSAINISLGSNTPVCVGSPINLTSSASGGTGAFSYAWTGPNSYSATGANVSIASATTLNTGSYLLTVTDANGCSATATTTVSVYNCQTLLNLTLFTQGYYVGSSTMQPVLFNEGVCNTCFTQTDTIVVELHHTTSPYGIVESVQAILMVDGTALATFSPAIAGHSYYIAILHRNAIQTWSKLPYAFTATGSAYNFSTADSQAYGNNMILVDVSPDIWAFYTGDINSGTQDQNIDLIDFPTLDYGINHGLFGYYASDLNGDGNVDLLDFPILDANINAGIFAQHP